MPTRTLLAQNLRLGISGQRERSLAWKGGRCIRNNGYIEILDREHPFATNRGYVLEHRLIMERQLGRYLLPNEQIHHINGNKQDNRLENLALLFINEHRSLHAKGSNNPFYGRKHSLESRIKIKEARKKQVGKNHPMYGKHHTEESKRKISETKRRKNG